MDLTNYKKIIKILIKGKLKLSVVESCTGGMLSAQITSIKGVSSIFDMGLITYSNYAKKKILNVSDTTLNKYGAVSKECCLEMVKKLSRLSKSDISLSITGIAGPLGGSKEKPVGLVFIGIMYKKKTTIKKFLFNKKFSRFKIQTMSCSKAISLIKKEVNL